MFSDPTFWAAIGTLILVVSAARPVARLLGGMLDTRSAQIKATLDEATNLREEAQHLLAEYKRKQQTAAKDAEEMTTIVRRIQTCGTLAKIFKSDVVIYVTVARDLAFRFGYPLRTSTTALEERTGVNEDPRAQ